MDTLRLSNEILHLVTPVTVCFGFIFQLGRLSECKIQRSRKNGGARSTYFTRSDKHNQFDGWDVIGEGESLLN